MPRTMPKAPTHATPRSRARIGFLAARKPSLGVMEKHSPGETGRKLAESLRAFRAEIADRAAADAELITGNPVQPPKPARKSRAKPKAPTLAEAEAVMNEFIPPA